MTDFAMGWGLFGEDESPAATVFAEPDDILHAIAEALKGQYEVEEQIGSGVPRTKITGSDAVKQNP